MKRSITILLNVVLLSAVSLTALAQSGRVSESKSPQHPAPPPDLAGIDLSDEQKASLKTIREKTQQQIQTLRDDQTTSDAEKQARIESIRQNSHQQSQSVLTPEQREAVAPHQANGGGRPNRGQGQARDAFDGRMGSQGNPNSGGLGGQRPGGTGGGMGGQRGGRRP